MHFIDKMNEIQSPPSTGQFLLGDSYRPLCQLRVVSSEGGCHAQGRLEKEGAGRGTMGHRCSHPEEGRGDGKISRA